MTIPSIGGNGDSANKIHINPQPQQPVGKSTQSVMQQQVSETLAQTSVQKENEKEYSIAQFRQDYSALVETKVMPILRDFEGERKKRLTFAIIAATFFSLIALYLLLFVDGNVGDAIGLCITAAGGSWFWIKKSFEKKIKRLIMPVLMHAVPGFYWQETPPVKDKDIQSCMILPFANKLSYKFDDCFVGEYRNVKVAISETECILGGGKNARTIFQGAIIRFHMNKNFDGMTVIRPKKAGYRDKKDDLKRANMSEVVLEDPEFNKKFVVYSTDQVEARYLITTAFMERFKQIEAAFVSKHAYCSFSANSIFIAPHTGKDLFNLCSLVKPIGNRQQFETLFNEFVSILSLVDHFKLDKKLGL